MSRHRKAPIYAEQVLAEFSTDRDLKKVNNAVIGFDRRFYDHLYPESAARDTLGERFSKLLIAADALSQKEKLELFLLSRDIAE
jgi:hypothetical protein